VERVSSDDTKKSLSLHMTMTKNGHYFLRKINKYRMTPSVTAPGDMNLSDATDDTITK